MRRRSCQANRLASEASNLGKQAGAVQHHPSPALQSPGAQSATATAAPTAAAGDKRVRQEIWCALSAAERSDFYLGADQVDSLLLADGH